MDIQAGPGEPGDMYEVGPLTYRQGYVCVWNESYAADEDALMHDRSIVAVYTGTPEQRGEQLFRAWVDAEELSSVLAHWATVLR